MPQAWVRVGKWRSKGDEEEDEGGLHAGCLKTHYLRMGEKEGR